MDIKGLVDKYGEPEVFRDLVYNGISYAGLYTISNYGRVRNSDGDLLEAYRRKRDNTYLVRGCRSIGLSDIIIARAVACTFIEEFDYATMSVVRLNGIYYDNFVLNLECTGGVDTNGYEVKKFSRCGVYNGNSKITEDDVREIRRMRGEYTYDQLAQMFGVSKSTIRDILCRKSWKHVH